MTGKLTFRSDGAILQRRVGGRTTCRSLAEGISSRRLEFAIMAASLIGDGNDQSVIYLDTVNWFPTLWSFESFPSVGLVLI